MPRLSELQKGESIIGLVYGSAGSGKTHFCGTAGSRALIINIGQGILTLQSKGFKQRYPNVDPIIETISEEIIPDKAQAYDDVCDLIDKYFKDPNLLNQFDTLIVDDATALRKMAMNKALEINDDLKMSESLKKSKKHDMLVAMVQDYGQEMSAIDQFISDYVGICRAHKKHFIITAHERINYNKPSSIGAPPTIYKIRPGFTGQTFPDSVTGYFDFVWYFETQGAGNQIKYYARTVGDSGLSAKTRDDGLFPIRLENPNFLNVVKRFRGG